MNADRLLAHYERIADSPDAVARLRRFVLDLALRGNGGTTRCRNC
jgi:type I restriction enzyme, S subunit